MAALLAINVTACTVTRALRVLPGRKTSVSYPQWGSILFHVALLMLLAGVGLNYLLFLRGQLLLIEGQTVVDEARSYRNRRVGPLLDSHLGFRLENRHLIPYYRVGKTATPAIRLAVYEDSRRVKTNLTYVNHPLYYRGYAFYIVEWGYAPEFEISPGPLRRRLSASVALPNRRVAGKLKYANHVQLPGSPQTLAVVLSPKKRRARVMLEEQGRRLVSGDLNQGESLSGEGVSLRFKRMRHWARLVATKDPGITWIYASFWLGFAGLALRFVRTLFD